MSLSGVSSPRATLPNTWIFSARYSRAMARTRSRCSTRRRPNGDLASNLCSMKTNLPSKSKLSHDGTLGEQTRSVSSGNR